MSLIARVKYLTQTRGEEAAKLYLRRYFRNPNNKLEFAAFLFPHYTTSVIPDFHREMYTLFDWSLAMRRNVAIAAPRGSAKSTAAGVIELCHIGLYHLRNFVVEISDTTTQAEGLLAPLQSEFENNERLIWLYGDMRSDKWNKADFVTKTGVRFLAKGSGMKIRGLRHNENRPDLILFDDLENDTEVLSEDQRIKTKNWMLAAALSALDPDEGIAWMVGTILHPQSLLSEIVHKMPPFEDWETRVYKALIDDAVSFWPSRFPVEWLKQKRKELGTFVFNQEYQNEPIIEGTRLCPPSYIKPIDTSVDLGDIGKSTHMACDPAISKKQTADKTGIVGGHAWVTATGDIRKIRVTYAHASRMTALETAQKLKDLDGILKPQDIGIEKVAYQQALVEITQKMGLPAKPMEVDGDKVRRFNRISPYMEQGLVEIDPQFTELIAQLLNFTGADGNEDDLVDAFVNFVSLCVEKPQAEFQIFVG